MMRHEGVKFRGTRGRVTRQLFKIKKNPEARKFAGNPAPSAPKNMPLRIILKLKCIIKLILFSKYFIKVPIKCKNTYYFFLILPLILN